MLIFAHRGASADAPENTLAAFLLAAEQGADGIELDVRQTLEGTIAVHHDPLPAFPPPAGFLTLDAVFEAVGNRFACINVELKESNGLEALVAASIARHRIADRVLFSSFLPEALRVCRQLCPAIPCALLFSRPVDDVSEWDVLHPHSSLVTVESLAKWQGKTINTWTVNDPEEIRRLAALGVHGLITDKPAFARAVVSPRA